MEIELMDDSGSKESDPTWSHLDELLDEALKQTFPASDAVAIAVERASGTQQDTKPIDRSAPGHH